MKLLTTTISTEGAMLWAWPARGWTSYNIWR